MSSEEAQTDSGAQTSRFATKYVQSLFAQNDFGGMPDASAHAIVEGVNLQSVYELAGMSRSEDPRVLSRAVEKVSEDLGLGNLSDRESRMLLIETILRQAIESKIEAHVAGRMIHLLRGDFGWTDDYRRYAAVIAYSFIWDEDVNSHAEVDDLILREARALLEGEVADPLERQAESATVLTSWRDHLGRGLSRFLS